MNDSANMATTQDEDMYLFQSGNMSTPSAFTGQDFDSFLNSTVAATELDNSTPAFLNPNDLSIKRENDNNSPGSGRYDQSPSGSGSSSSSSDSPEYDERIRPNGSSATWGTGINGFSMPSNDQYFEDSSMTGIDQDFEASNRQMASDFDFDTAASTPSGFNNLTQSTMKPTIPFNQASQYKNFVSGKSTSPQLPTTGKPQFFFANSRETSPMNAMLSTTQGQSPWNKHSPSSGLEETFNHITMNGDSPGNATFSPNLHFSSAGFTFEPESSTTPSTFTKDISSPPSTVNSIDGNPQLTIHPTSLKSRVETQIPIKMTLSPMPPGIKKLRLPTYTISKPKFLAKLEVDRSPEILELYTSLVCTSAMQDPVKRDRAWARARGEDSLSLTRASPASSNISDDEDKPLNGGEVKICPGCIQRERKRASRKKQKKPEEEELFQKDEEKRVVVFNTNELKDWVDPSQENPDQPTKPLPNTLQVELPMRIACYCRHQNEKLGFQVIFTIKDYRDKVIAQAMTNSIMITDDHKTHNAPTATQTNTTQLPNNPQLPGAGVFSTENPSIQNNPKNFKQSFSTTDLHGLQHNFNPSFPMTPTNNPFAISGGISNHTSNTMTPRNLSRPASPSGVTGPNTKRRKQSGSGKLPSGLTMTRLDTSQNTVPGSIPITTTSTPFASNLQTFIPPTERSFPMQNPRPIPFGTSPPTPNGNDSTFMTNINRSYSLENLPRQNMISAPPSRQQSRPGSPGSTRNNYGTNDNNFGQAVSNQLMAQPSRRPPPLIHKLVPAEGSITGGTEVTLLGNGFYQGLEVMFGDTEATTTTFWGEKCLNCIAPPALQPGVVAVVFKHEHPQYSSIQQTSQSKPSIFTYIDNREIEMFRLALRTIGKHMNHPTDDPVSAAQQLLQGQSHNMWQNYGNNHQSHQRHNMTEELDTLELETNMLQMLEYLDRSQKQPKLDLSRPSGLTLLHLGASLGLTRFVVGLLSRGANPNLIDNNGYTPMHHAAMNGHTHIIHRLRLAGANHLIRNITNFSPADVATSLLTYQATINPIHHYRSRSVGGTPMRLHSRNESSSSLKSFWENTSNFNTNFDTDTSDDDDEIDDDNEEINPMIMIQQSRRGSTQEVSRVLPTFPSEIVARDQSTGPSVFMLAWRDHLVAQLHQFNESAQSVMPTLATLNGPLQALQDYQAPMVRRVSSLFPQRPNSRQQNGQKEGWWETLTGSASPTPSSPPAYGDLYPEKNTNDDDWSLKKSSAAQATIDAAADLHFENQSTSETTKQKLNQISVARVELSRDRNLFFFWIPILAIILALMIRNSGILNSVSPQINEIVEREIVEVL